MLVFQHVTVCNGLFLLQASDNGVVDCTDGSRYESICTLKCNKGFEMSEGKGRTKCLSTTEWSKDIGNCKSKCSTLIPNIMMLHIEIYGTYRSW